MAVPASSSPNVTKPRAAGRLDSLMDTLSEVSKYLNNLEAYLDNGDSPETRMGKIEKSEQELEMFEALEH
ncbi:hypothetical protein Tco_0798105 [Tanacetum coccineum]